MLMPSIPARTANSTASWPWHGPCNFHAVVCFGDSNFQFLKAQLDPVGVLMLGKAAETSASMI
jgi:hypothetical protein